MDKIEEIARAIDKVTGFYFPRDDCVADPALMLRTMPVPVMAFGFDPG